MPCAVFSQTPISFVGLTEEEAVNQGINCEHTWPQSMGANQEPQKSDLHHLYPCKSNVNSSRGNHPYSEIIDTGKQNLFMNVSTLPPSLGCQESQSKSLVIKLGVMLLLQVERNPRNSHKHSAVPHLSNFS